MRGAGASKGVADGRGGTRHLHEGPNTGGDELISTPEAKNLQKRQEMIKTAGFLEPKIPSLLNWLIIPLVDECVMEAGERTSLALYCSFRKLAKQIGCSLPLFSSATGFCYI